MSKGIPLEEILGRLPPEEQASIRARADELIAEEMTLRDLRKAMGKTQVALAKKLRIKQEAVSRAEQRTDMLLSTLDHYLHGLGGKLRLIAEFKGRAPVTLTGLADIGAGAARPKPRRAAVASAARTGRKRAD